MSRSSSFSHENPLSVSRWKLLNPKSARTTSAFSKMVVDPMVEKLALVICSLFLSASERVG
jgi:hypothetical protein